MMNANKIANADVLDIIFDGRNKLYGAYTLRRQYNKRMATAMGIVLSVCLIIFFTTLRAGKPEERMIAMEIADKVLEKVNPDEQLPVVPPPEPPPPVEQVRTEDFVSPVVLPDDQVPPEEMPPTQADMQDAVISNYKQDGLDATDILAPAPPKETGTGLAVQLTKPQDDTEIIFVTVQLKAEFPGGPNAWRRFLESNLRYPDQAVENGKQGIVSVEFVIDQEGVLSQIRALNDPGDGLADEAIRIMKKSPKWRPAEQNGRTVKYRHRQNIVFALESN